MDRRHDLPGRARRVGADEAPDLLADPFMLSLGTQIDREEDIGSGGATRICFDGTWWFTERNKLRALWFSSSVSRSTRL